MKIFNEFWPIWRVSFKRTQRYWCWLCAWIWHLFTFVRCGLCMFEWSVFKGANILYIAAVGAYVLRICIKQNSCSFPMFSYFLVILSFVSCLIIFVVISRMTFIEIWSKLLHFTTSSKDFSRSIKPETLLIVLVNCPTWLLLWLLSWIIYSL